MDFATQAAQVHGVPEPLETSDLLWNLEEVTLHGRHGPRLHPLNLRLRTGRTAVIGYSGAGKTSLLNLLVGFEKPDGGRITSRNGSLAWVPPDAGLWPHLTVREHFATVRPGDPADLLRNFDLAHKLASRPDELSEGEQSRLSVARALWTNAAVLVMDEPMVHVDPTRAAVCWEAIRCHLETTGASLVFSTHSPETVLGGAERAVCLKAGHLLYEGSVEELYQHPPNVELAGFLGVANWLEPTEARQWLGVEIAEACCWRPEQIQIVPGGEKTGFLVAGASFRGSVAEADLRDEATGATRRFYHRPASGNLRTGTRVRIIIL